MNPGFCKSLPAQMKIDSIRVYQNKKDDLQTVGCNPKAFPTKTYILAHQNKYKTLIDKLPIKPIVTGGGSCKKNEECGEGRCRLNMCYCNSGWQGPNCLVNKISLRKFIQ